VVVGLHREQQARPDVVAVEAVHGLGRELAGDGDVALIDRHLPLLDRDLALFFCLRLGRGASVRLTQSLVPLAPGHDAE
jgi:hypothetical protein